MVNQKIVLGAVGVMAFFILACASGGVSSSNNDGTLAECTVTSSAMCTGGPYAKACTNFTCSGQTATASRQTYNVTFRDLATDCFNIDVYTNAIAYRPYSANSAAEAESCGSTELANCTPTAAYAGNLQNFCVAGFKELSDTPEHAQRCIGFRYNVYGAPYACTW